MKRIDIKTKDKVDKLSKALGIESNSKRDVLKKDIIKSGDSPFKTSEVLILVIVTCVVSLLMGFLLEYRFNYNKGKNLDPELKEFINNYEYIKENYYEEFDKSKLVDGAVAGMLSVLDKNSSYVGDDDSNFNIYLDGNYKGIGVEVYEKDGNIIIYKVMDKSPASKAGLKPDDIIVKVQDKEVKGMDTAEVSALIKSFKEEFTIVYNRKGENLEAKLKIDDISISSVYSQIIEKNNKKIGYIRLNVFASNSYEQFKKNLNDLNKAGVKDLIIDLRSNSGGHLATAADILSLFLDSSHPIYQIKDKGKQKKYYSTGKKDYDGRLAVLVNSGSASASEILSSALNEQLKATIIGEKTYGKGTVQEMQTLSTGGKYKLTTKIWLTSKGKNIDQKGFEPDILVELGEDYYNDPKGENDNQLNKAISEILK